MIEDTEREQRAPRIEIGVKSGQIVTETAHADPAPLLRGCGALAGGVWIRLDGRSGRASAQLAGRHLAGRG